MTRNAVVSGGTGALGQAVVDRLGADGVHCHVTWKFKEELAHFRRGEHVTLHEVDCADEAQVDAFYGGLDSLDASIHIVGGFAMAGVLDTRREDFVAMFELNAVLLSRLQLHSGWELELNS